MTIFVTAYNLVNVHKEQLNRSRCSLLVIGICPTGHSDHDTMINHIGNLFIKDSKLLYYACYYTVPQSANKAGPSLVRHRPCTPVFFFFTRKVRMISACPVLQSYIEDFFYIDSWTNNWIGQTIFLNVAIAGSPLRGCFSFRISHRV